MQLAHPQYLWLLLLIVPLTAWYIWKHRSLHPAMEMSTTVPFAKLDVRFVVVAASPAVPAPDVCSGLCHRDSRPSSDTRLMEHIVC